MERRFWLDLGEEGAGDKGAIGATRRASCLLFGGGAFVGVETGAGAATNGGSAASSSSICSFNNGTFSSVVGVASTGVGVGVTATATATAFSSTGSAKESGLRL